MRALAVVLASLAVAVALAGAVGSTSAPETRLRITFWAEGKGTPARSWTLRCNPPGGSLPRARAACRALHRLPDPFKRVPWGAICTAIYGGPEEGLVRGVYRGRRVYARFRMQNGCEIARFRRVAFLFPALVLER